MPKARLVQSPHPLPHWDTLDRLDRKALALVWQQAFGRPIPSRLFRNTAIPLLAYRLQALQFGDLSPQAERTLARLIPRPGEKRPSALPRRLKTGVRLMREWQGRTYTVQVTDTGYTFEDQPYQSLSAIARKITGTPWSGPAFFGLKKTPPAVHGARA
jgi:hypothetical protein